MKCRQGLEKPSFRYLIPCVAGARRGGGIGEIRRALECKGGVQEVGVAPAASPLFGSYFTVVF